MHLHIQCGADSCAGRLLLELRLLFLLSPERPAGGDPVAASPSKEGQRRPLTCRCGFWLRFRFPCLIPQQNRAVSIDPISQISAQSLHVRCALQGCRVWFWRQVLSFLFFPVVRWLHVEEWEVAGKQLLFILAHGDDLVGCAICQSPCVFLLVYLASYEWNFFKLVESVNDEYR